VVHLNTMYSVTLQKEEVEFQIQLMFY